MSSSQIQIMKKIFISILLSFFSMGAFAQKNTIYISPEKMMYDLTEEATCIAAATYLGVDRQTVHRSNFTTLVMEYQVPKDVEERILEMNKKQYMQFITRATKRYQPEILPSMLLSAYTHRCEFMNGFEARRQFNSSPPEI
jgi:hypothetical protein